MRKQFAFFSIIAAFALLCVSCELLGLTQDPEDGAPGPATQLSALPGDGIVTLGWSDPSETDVHHMEITVTPGGAPAIRIATQVRAAIIGNLANGTAYTFAICSVDNAGNRSASASIQATPTMAVDLTPPAEVGSPVAIAGDRKVALTWTDPPDADRDHILVTWTPDPGSKVIALTVQGAMIDGLTNGLSYAFTIRTVDHEGNASTGVQASATPNAIADTSAPVIGTAYYTPNPAYINRTILIRVIANDPQSPVTLTFDTDGDAVFDNSPYVNYSSSGDRSVDFKAESLGGSVSGSLTISVLDDPDPASGLPVIWNGDCIIDAT
ncbi:MAG: hypothetical protein Q8M76_06795, partial [Spirochaetaceae bacterium]|nr:hypothetical protein [Spirochaetaceae bacterium]